jgi:hypothetical protein
VGVAVWAIRFMERLPWKENGDKGAIRFGVVARGSFGS